MKKMGCLFIVVSLLVLGFAIYGIRAAFFTNNKVEMLRQQKRELQSNISVLEADLEALQTENADLQAEAESLHAENSALHENSKSLQAENLALQVESESLHAENSALQEIATVTTTSSSNTTTAPISATCWYFKQFFAIPVHNNLDLDNPTFYQLPHKSEDGKVRDLSIILDTAQVTSISLVEVGQKTPLDFGQAGGMTYFYFYMPKGGDYIFEITTSNGNAYYIMVGYHNN